MEAAEDTFLSDTEMFLFLHDKLICSLPSTCTRGNGDTHTLTWADSTPGPTHARLALWAEKTDEAQHLEVKVK